MTLRFGIFPHLVIDKSSIKGFSRNQKLWAYGTILIFKLFLFNLGIFCWQAFRGSQTLLFAFCLILVQAALLGFILQFNPFRTLDGYKWLAYFFRFPPTYSNRILPVFLLTIQRRPLPSSISNRERIFLVASGAIFIFLLVYVLLKITLHAIAGIYSIFPDILGQGTMFFIGFLVIILILRLLSPQLSKLNHFTGTGYQTDAYQNSHSSSIGNSSQTIKGQELRS